jgi:hypothetical protein
MERFVQYVVAGGVAMVVGLWVAVLAARFSAPWAVGVALALAGATAQAWGIRSRVER